MKTTIKTLGFIGLTILLIFVLTKNKEIRQYKINEQEQLEVLDTLQLELDSLKIQLKNILRKVDSIPVPINVSDWNWIAVSQDLLKKNGGVFNYGDQVYVSGTHKDGIYTIHDCMNKRKTFQIDILESIGTSQYKYDEIEIFALND